MKRLNKVQHRILNIGILLLIAMTAYPPWRAITSPPDSGISQTVGYAFITRPPNSPLGFESYVVINYLRLFLQWVGLVLVVWFGIWLVRKK